MDCQVSARWNGFVRNKNETIRYNFSIASQQCVHTDSGGGRDTAERRSPYLRDVRGRMPIGRRAHHKVSRDRINALNESDPFLILQNQRQSPSRLSHAHFDRGEDEKRRPGGGRTRKRHAEVPSGGRGDVWTRGRGGIAVAQTPCTRGTMLARVLCASQISPSYMPSCIFGFGH